MKKTDNYSLPQWEKQDFIKMEDFNDAFGKTDAALKAHDTALKANADAAATGLNAEIAAVQEQIVAVEQEIKLVSFGEPRTTTAANGSIVYDLSALNMADYRAFLVFASAAQQDGYTGKIELACGDKDIGQIAQIVGGRMSTVAWVFPAKFGVAAVYQAVKQGFRGNAENGSGVALNEKADWNGMPSMTFRFTAQSGGSVVLYGLKK